MDSREIVYELLDTVTASSRFALNDEDGLSIYIHIFRYKNTYCDEWWTDHRVPKPEQPPNLLERAKRNGQLLGDMAQPASLWTPELYAKPGSGSRRCCAAKKVQLLKMPNMMQWSCSHLLKTKVELYSVTCANDAHKSQAWIWEQWRIFPTKLRIRHRIEEKKRRNENSPRTPKSGFCGLGCYAIAGIFHRNCGKYEANCGSNSGLRAWILFSRLLTIYFYCIWKRCAFRFFEKHTFFFSAPCNSRDFPLLQGISFCHIAFSVCLIRSIKRGLLRSYFMTDEWNTHSKWDKCKLGPCCSKIGSGKTPRGGSSVYVDHGVTFLRSQNVLWGTLDLNDVSLYWRRNK